MDDVNALIMLLFFWFMPVNVRRSKTLDAPNQPAQGLFSVARDWRVPDWLLVGLFCTAIATLRILMHARPQITAVYSRRRLDAVVVRC